MLSSQLSGVSHSVRLRVTVWHFEVRMRISKCDSPVPPVYGLPLCVSPWLLRLTASC
jgi:hypothetical protein